MKKKILSLMLIAFSLMIVFTGCGNNVQDKVAVIAETDDMILTIYTFDGKSESVFGLTNLGHSFLSFENISNEEIQVGKRTIAPQETITVGLWSIKAHFGVWYNMESNYIADYDKYNGRGSVSMGITKTDVDKLNEYISSHDIWTPLYNCSNFATNAWNLVASDSEKVKKTVIYTPSELMAELKKFTTFETNKQIITAEKFCYYNGNTPVYYELEK